MRLSDTHWQQNLQLRHVDVIQMTINPLTRPALNTWILIKSHLYTPALRLWSDTKLFKVYISLPNTARLSETSQPGLDHLLKASAVNDLE